MSSHTFTPGMGNAYTAHGMPNVIQRPSLVAETAKALRAAIRGGEFGRALPPERQLSRTLNISRITLRAALEQLEQEGYIDKQGKNARQTLVKIPRRRKARRTMRVRLLHVREPGGDVERDFLFAETFAHAGMEFEHDLFPAHAVRSPERALEELLRSRLADLWILSLSTHQMQRWFMEQKIPCLVLGSVFKDVALPSMDVDQRAIGRHAAGLLLARGHRSLAVLRPEVMRAGDQNCVEGFREGVLGSRHNEARITQVPCGYESHRDMTIADSLRTRKNPPDGWFILKSRVCMTVLTHLLRRGVKVGQEASVLCRNPDAYFPVLAPSVAHYRHDIDEAARRILRLLPRLLRGGPVPPPILVQAHFQAGESLRKRNT